MGSVATVRFAGALVAAGSLAGQLPVALRVRGHALTPLATDAEQSATAVGSAAHRPVICVHGFASSAGCWRPLAQRLSAAGFTEVHSFSYNALTCDLRAAARALSSATRVLCREEGHDYVHLVGHSLGGLLVRASAECYGLWPYVGGLVTVATPHRGSRWSRLALGPNRWWLQPRTATVTEPVVGRNGAGAPTYLNYYSPDDAVVPARSAVLRRPGVHNLALPGVGHVGAAAAPSLLEVLPDRLAAVETHRGRGARTRSVPRPSAGAFGWPTTGAPAPLALPA